MVEDTEWRLYGDQKRGEMGRWDKVNMPCLVSRPRDKGNEKVSKGMFLVHLLE